jgi:hypothetical protein
MKTDRLTDRLTDRQTDIQSVCVRARERETWRLQSS